MPARGWKFHFGRLAGVAVLVLLFGLLIGHWLLVSALALALYIGWQLFNTMRLYAWLGHSAPEPPESHGVWAEIFDQIRLLQKSNREQSLRHEHVIEEFRSMTDAFPDATLVIDETDNITWFNDAARRLLGLRVPEDLGQPVTNLLRGPDFANWISVEEQVESRLEMPSPQDSNVFLSVSAVHYREGQRLLILRDVTDLHNLEAVRRDFVANVSHELRTPLTVLLGYLESIQGACPDDLAPAVDRMQEQARQMQALLNDLLELSRLQSDQPGSDERRVDVPAMLMQLREQAEELSQGNHVINFQVESGLDLHGAPADLESAFRNLINNAIHYTPAGGRIDVEWWGDMDTARLVVRDTGIGIPKRDIPRLTERFYRVGSDRSRHRGGTGLGLSIVKHVLNAHQARLLIDSELGEGSCFTCVFPRERLRLGGAEEVASGS